MKLIKYLASQVPIDSKLKLIIGGTAYVGIFNPTKFSVLGYMLNKIDSTQGWVNDFALIREGLDYSLLVGTSLGLALIGSKLIYNGEAKAKINKKKLKKPARQVYIGNGSKGMYFDEKDLFTNIMITGAIGSGKTSSAIYPVLEQLLDIYNVEDDVTDKNDPYQKLGGLVLDVKGDFYEALIWLMHRAGRNVLNDLVVITPFADYAYLELVEEESGRHFYISARGGGDTDSNETTNLFNGYFMPDPYTLEPDPKSPIPVELLTNIRQFKKKINEDFDVTYEDYIKNLELDVSNKKVNYIGWREDGGRLKRVLHTNKHKEVIYAKDIEGNYIYTNIPKKLKFKRVRYVNNGLTFNICPPSLGPAELASRLTSMSKNASGGGGGGGDNSFWDDATKKHIGWCVMLLREVNQDAEVTAIDLNQMTTNEDRIEDEVSKLHKVIQEKEMLCSSLTGGEKEALAGELLILKDMQNYFESEWGELDQRTKSNLQATITNLFGQFMSDPKLRRVFCTSSSFKIEEIMQSGKIFTLVAPEYESAARVFGTALKLEFQALLRRRPAQSHFNKERFILFMCDEAQNYVTAGGSDNTGDENFMALSRQSKVCNIIATQSDSSIINVIGEKAAPVYYQGFGSRIWYQNLDPKTNDLAAKILGKKKIEKRSSSGEEFSLANMFSKEAKGPKYNVSQETKERFPAESFSNLNVHECVMYNKGKKGSKDKAAKAKLKPHFVGDPARRAEKNGVIRWYFQAYIENQLFKNKEYEILDLSDAGDVVCPYIEDKKSVTPKIVKQKEEKKDLIEDFNEESQSEDSPKPLTKEGENLLGWKKEKVEIKEEKNLTEEDIPFLEDADEINEVLKNRLPEHVKDALDSYEEDDIELDEDDLDEIRKRFGDEKEIGNKLHEYVTIVDKAAKISTDFEPEYADDIESLDGAAVTGEDGFFNAGSELEEVQKSEKKVKKKEEVSDIKPEEEDESRDEEESVDDLEDLFKSELELLDESNEEDTPADSLKDLLLDDD